MSRIVRDPRLALAVCTLILGAAIAFPLGVIASHQFFDVPDDNTYHNDIAALADAGVTSGCGDDNFCPDEYVTREQMAAFMNRLGALAPGKVPVVNADKLDGVNSTQFARKDVQLSGTAVCGAGGAVPGSSGAAWVNFGTSVFAALAENLTVYCQIVLPEDATVTQVRWRVSDDSATEYVDCKFLAELAQGAGYQIATGVTTAGFASGLTTLTDATVQGGAQGAPFYVSSCLLTAQGFDTVFYWVEADYTVPGLPMP